MRVGALDVSILVDAEGSFATIAQAFPALSSSDEWRLPVNVTGRRQTVELTPENASERTKSF